MTVRYFKSTFIYIPVLLCLAFQACKTEDPLARPQEQKEEEEEKPAAHEIPTSSAAIYGYVKDNSGNPVADAVVSDGYGCTKTESDGYYCLISPKPSRAKFAFVSIPSGYEPLIGDGLPKFYTKLKSASGKARNADITIKKMAMSQDEFYFIFTADPQARSESKSWREKVAFKSLSAYEDLFDDQQEYVASLGNKPCYGIALGDICFNDPSVYTQYIAGMKRIGIPFYGTIGNHDHQAADKNNDDECAVEYEAVFGPRNFSVNIGNIHVISLDDMFFQPDAATGKCINNTYSTGIEDDFMNWIRADLKYVPKTTPVFICVHSPLVGKDGVSTTLLNAQALATALTGYKAYFWAGHVHGSRCFTFDPTSTSGNIETHTLFRSTGPLYLNEYVCGDGTPRGYVVMHVKGKDISWQFKPTAICKGEYMSFTPSYNWCDWHYVNGRAVMNDGSGTLDSRYQIRAYSRGDYDDDFIYANVFMWDPKWGIPTVTIEGQTYQMKQAVIYDQTYKEIAMNFFRANTKFADLEDEFEYASKVHYHHFIFRVPDNAKGKATVSVTDRFGNKYSYDVSADPKVYTDGRLHLKFDFDSNSIGLPEKNTTKVSFNYTVDGTKYSFYLSRGYFNATNGYLAISGASQSLKLPAISGYRLTGVTARTANNTAERRALISSDAAGTKVVNGGNNLLFCGDCSDSWNLYDTALNTEYYLFNVGSGFPLAELRLTYSK